MMNLLKSHKNSQRNHLDKITVKIKKKKIINMLIVQKKKKKWRDLDYLFNGIEYF